MSDPTTTEQAARLEHMARRLRRSDCHAVAQNLEWDAAELRRGVTPGSAASWRSSGLDLLGAA